MPTVFSRDLALDLSLESEARTTLIILGVAIALLVLGTTIFFLWYPTLTFLRHALHLEDKASTKNISAEESGEISDEETEDMPTENTLSQRRREQQAVNTSRMAVLFGPSPIRKCPSAPHRPRAQVYRGAEGLHIPPPPALGTSPAAFNRGVAPGVVTPHIAQWMAVADAVVGAHPHAQPLSARVATQAEIDMISGHVHIPWAYNDTRKPQPAAVKVQQPVVFHPAVPVQSRLLKDVGNLYDKHVQANTDMANVKRSAKGKNVPRSRGKENMPPGPSPPGNVRCRN